MKRKKNCKKYCKKMEIFKKMKNIVTFLMKKKIEKKQKK
jgi:hypothetical protein